ncbi:hypothetical protein CLV86_0405 [Lacinutrix venerupis]|uniref:Dihydroorotase n=1 Tax=Lacinutrix venerupis TaxID=1486034 RepID=A0AAC9LM75_9FLAO|nr:dihydroorotase [Lacinutrix venerupis]APY00168.1 dihydroorotase [Lacinutrix venerupis]RLJ69013.1 hypothetical protein CLV86_0405 [Lacinutrix venerupis]
MKNYVLLAFLFSFLTNLMFSQTTKLNTEIGDVFVIGDVKNNNYKSIDFPRANFIIKKGGLVNYDDLKGEKVEITSIKEAKDGSVIATIMLASKKKFFNSHKYVKVNINEALNNKELLRI